MFLFFVLMFMLKACTNIYALCIAALSSMYFICQSLKTKKDLFFSTTHRCFHAESFKCFL